MSDMTDDDSSRKGTAHENLPEMIDNVIRQLDFTRKIIIIMVLSFVIIVPIIAYIGLLSQSTAGVGVYITIIGGAVFLAWLGVGIRQWIVFSKWLRKFRLYKERQKELEDLLDFEKSDDGKSSSPN
jgi:energy-coupling factor transporter transmembrane protein EcfT